MARKRLTEKDWHTIAFALNCAIEERDSFADAYSYTGPEAKDALAAVERFKALYRKLFNEPSEVERFSAAMDAMEKVSVIQLMKGGPPKA